MSRLSLRDLTYSTNIAASRGSTSGIDSISFIFVPLIMHSLKLVSIFPPCMDQLINSRRESKLIRSMLSQSHPIQQSNPVMPSAPSKSSNGRVTSADWRDDYKDLSLLHPEQFDASFFDIQPVLDAASRQVSASPTTPSPVKSTSAAFLKYLDTSGAPGASGAGTASSAGYFPPMPSLGTFKSTRGLSTASWYDPSQMPAVEQKVSSSDFVSQYILKDDADDNVKRSKSEDEEWTPEKDGSSNKRKRTGTAGATTSTTNKRKRRAASTRRRRADSVPDAVEDAVTELGKFDVAMGRGGMANNHIGNRHFRKMAESLKPAYQKLQKEEKTDISIKLVQMVHDKGGRFLAKDPADELWYEVDFKLARRKASQALREETKEEREERHRREAEEEEEYGY